jgi:hypothetical protein
MGSISGTVWFLYETPKNDGQRPRVNPQRQDEWQQSVKKKAYTWAQET